MNDGLVNGALTFIPSLAGLYLALKNKKFRQVRSVHPTIVICTIQYAIAGCFENRARARGRVACRRFRRGGYNSIRSSTPELMSSVTGERYTKKILH